MIIHYCTSGVQHGVHADCTFYIYKYYCLYLTPYKNLAILEKHESHDHKKLHATNSHNF